MSLIPLPPLYPPSEPVSRSLLSLDVPKASHLTKAQIDLDVGDQGGDPTKGTGDQVVDGTSTTTDEVGEEVAIVPSVPVGGLDFYSYDMMFTEPAEVMVDVLPTTGLCMNAAKVTDEASQLARFNTQSGPMVVVKDWIAGTVAFPVNFYLPGMSVPDCRPTRMVFVPLMGEGFMAMRYISYIDLAEEGDQIMAMMAAQRTDNDEEVADRSSSPAASEVETEYDLPPPRAQLVVNRTRPETPETRPETPEARLEDPDSDKENRAPHPRRAPDWNHILAGNFFG